MSASPKKAHGRFDRSRLPDAFAWFDSQGMVLHGRGRWRLTCCPMHDDRSPSLSVNAEGGFACHACNERGGDLVAFLMRRDGLTFIEAARELGAWVDTDAAPELPSERAARKAEVERMRREAAERAEVEQRRQWAERAPRLAALRAAADAILPGDAASLYLKQRGLILARFPEVLRFVPRLAYRHADDTITHHPAMIAGVVSSDGALVALHRTYLRADGTKADVPIVKKLTPTAGPMAGAAIRLHPMGTDGVLGVAEGIETALAAHLGAGVPVWAAISAHGLASFVWPPGCRRLLVFADNDASGTGQRAAEALASRARTGGLSVSILMPAEAGMDWADVWAQRARAEVAA